MPFVGHKGHWGIELTEIASKLPPECIIFDVFGGSGICAEYFKRARPDLTVVWNDFDHYRARLDNVDKTENLRQLFLAHLGRPLPKNTFIPPLSDDHRQFVLDTLKQQLADVGFVDFQTVSRWFYLYCMKTYRLMSASGKLYNRVPVVPLRAAACGSWLADVHRTSTEFVGLDTVFSVSGRNLKPRDFIDTQNALLVLDPPYLGTGTSDYDNQDALHVLRSIAESCEHLPFLLFGDASIAFWYEQIFKGRRFFKIEKQINNIAMGGKRRTEVLFVCLP